MPDDPLETTTRRLGSEYGNLGGDPLDGELEAQFEALAQKRRERRRRRLTRAERSLEQSLQQEESLKNAAAVDPSFWQEHFGEGTIGGEAVSGLGKLLENSPLAGIPETIGGLLSFPTEGAAVVQQAITGEAPLDPVTLEPVNPRYGHQMDALGAALNLNPLGLLANVVGFGTKDSDLRQRGREFFERAGKARSAAYERVAHGKGMPGGEAEYPVLGRVSAPDQALVSAAEDYDMLDRPSAEKLRTHFSEVGGQVLVDPTLIADLPFSAVMEGAYKAAKASKLGQAAIKRFPKLALLPERAWLKFNNRYKEAMVLGDEKAQELYALDRAFSEEAAPELLKIQQDIVEGEAKLFSRVEAPWRKEAGLAGREETLGLLSNVVEAPKEWRKVEAARLSDDDVVRETLLEAAEFYDDIAAKTAAVERKFGIQTADLQGEFEYFMRQLSPELREFMRTNPSARKILTGEAGRLGRLEFEQAWAGYEKGRKLGDYNYRDSEDILRKTLREEAGLPDDIPIWDRDAFGLLRNRLERDTERMKVRHLYAAATDVYGQAGAQGDELAGIVGEALDEKQAAAWAKAAQGKLDAMDAADTLAGFRAGRSELRRAAAAAGRPAQDLPEAAAVLGDIGAEAKGAAGAIGESRIAEGGVGEVKLKDEAEFILRQLADDVALRVNAIAPEGGTALSRDVTRRAQQAVARFQDAYQKAVTLPEYRRAVRAFADELKEAAPPSLVREYGQLAQRATAQLDRLTAGVDGAVNRNVASAVAGKARAADKKAAELLAKAENTDPAKWSVETKAAWVESVVERNGLKPPAGHMSALQLLKDKKVALPDDIQSLSKLATTWISPADAKFVAKYADNFYWRGLDTRGAVGRFLDGLKGILQRSLLASPRSLSKDWIGTASQGFMAGHLAYLEGARKSLGGTWVQWAKGIGKGFHADDDVLKLMAEGVLNTTRHDALEKGLLEGIPVLGRIEERGLIGAALPGKAGEAVAKVTDSMLDARVWFEQVNRLATYRKAIQEGLSHREAVEQVYAYWGKFDELSKFDRNVLNRLFLFWSWRKASVPIALRNLLDKPLRARLLMIMMAGNTEDDERIPEWARRLGGWTAGTDANGNMRVISVGDSSYFGPLASLVRSDSMKALKQGEYQAFVSGAAREVLRSTPAYWQSVGELTQEQDYFTNQSWWGGEGRTGQTTKAPMAFWWLMNHDPEGKPTALQELLGLKDIRGERDPETGEPGPLRHITMKPAAAWLLGALPGAEPLLTDVSAFVDPRSADVGEASLLKGGARVAGVPIYSVAPPDEQQTLIRDVREALHKDADRLAGGALDVYAGRLTPSNTGRGQSLRRDMEQWQAEAKAQGLGEYAARAYVDLRLQRLYQQEWRLMELDRRLAYLQRERTKGVKEQRQFQLGDAA